MTSKRVIPEVELCSKDTFIKISVESKPSLFIDVVRDGETLLENIISCMGKMTYNEIQNLVTNLDGAADEGRFRLSLGIGGINVE